MIKFKLVLLLLIITCCYTKQDECSPFKVYKTCINNLQLKCVWDQSKKLCTTTSEYLLGCNPNLSKLACAMQLGDEKKSVAKCRFITICEEIPDPSKEKCSSNLNKSGCLSITNLNQICFWKDNQCKVLESNDRNVIQKNFANTLYSQSACAYIENFLIIHHLTLWKLINYTPNLMLEDDLAFLQDYQIYAENQKVYDDPLLKFLQNNYVNAEGKFVWYTIRESKQITLTNLEISDRYREGCIALEIENDSDYGVIFSQKDQVVGINHIYCQYLNKMLESYPYYIFLDGQCKIFEKENLNNQTVIQQLNLNCYLFNAYYCVYFDSLNHSCQIFGDDFQYPCQDKTNQTKVQCKDSVCTVQQCKQLNNYYIDKESNICTQNCFNKRSQKDCETYTNCVFLGNSIIDSQIICSPYDVCDQIGVSLSTCRLLKANCQWNETLNRCYTISDEEKSYLKCEEAYNINICIQIQLSDQLCFWQQSTGICLNVLNQSVLLQFPYFIEQYFQPFYDEPPYDSYTISNQNFCKQNSLFYSQYDKANGHCYFSFTLLVTNYNTISKFDCLNAAPGFCIWNQQYQQCECYSELYFKTKQCNDLIDVNEKCCQFAQVSNELNICLFDSQTYTCKEKLESSLDQSICGGLGLSETKCINNLLCRYQANFCGKLTTKYINSLTCQSFHLVNYQVCKYHNKDSQLCDYDKKTKSCFVPGQLELINYKVSLNRFACAQVQDLPTFYDIFLNSCVVFDEGNQQLLNSFTCAGYFLSKKACLLIKKVGQICFWNNKSNQCELYVSEFTKCSDYQDSGERSCKGLVRDLSQTLILENFCEYIDEQCEQVVNSIQGCGENQKMNLHRCNSLTGLDSNVVPIKMCAFINQQCIGLTENSYSTYLLLQEITCKQANLATCVKVQTRGEYCVQIFFKNSNNSSIVFDQKCKPVNLFQQTCLQLRSQYNKDIINKIFCAQAIDDCYYDENTGCTETLSNDFYCDTLGLSAQSCFNNTNNRRCAFINNQCQYLSENSLFTDCLLLNSHLCSEYKYAQCIWKENHCQKDEKSENITKYSCSRDTNNKFQIFQNNTCLQVSTSDLYSFSCDLEGINYYTCQNIKKQYCIFIQNECQFYRKIPCQESSSCGDNSTGNQNCVLKNQKCFHIQTPSQYLCNQFEETNYEFCYQFKDCIYASKQCQTLQKITKQQYCWYKLSITDCIFNNYNGSCGYNDEQKRCYALYQFKGECPSFTGYFSAYTCWNFKCNYGHTKTGIGFCYTGDILDVTCEQIPKLFCLEDMSHLNQKLNCYYDGQCKTLNEQNLSCEFLNQYQSNYPSCLLVNRDQKCLYSHNDHICKPLQQYLSSICQGSTSIQCSLIENTCYFDGSLCKDSGLTVQLNKFGCLLQDGYWQFKNFQCVELPAEQILQSCYLISKKACLSPMTGELYCRWINNQCQQVLVEEGKLIDSCVNLNERVCLEIRLSNIFCKWDSNANECQDIEITSKDCTYVSPDFKVSLSVCGSQLNTPCIRNENGLSCEIINIIRNDCTESGLNEYGCIYNTSGDCEWKTINGGGFCDIANLVIAQCNQRFNKNACQKINIQGQFCYWNESTKRCDNKILTDCESANYFNNYFCFAITQEYCWYNQITNQCKKFTEAPNGCYNYYNIVACLSQSQYCQWNNNQCESFQPQCSQILDRIVCLNSNKACQWQINKCVEFQQISPKIHCLDIPLNVSNNVCSSSSIEPCQYNSYRDQCYPYLKNPEPYIVTVIDDILKFQDKNFISAILSGECSEFRILDDCIGSRKSDQSCIWNGSCQRVVDYTFINCTDNLNIYGCLNVSKQDQHCMWQGKCFNWDIQQNIFTNVNTNVCKKYTFNKIYRYQSCISVDVDDIQCENLGVSKKTCLSLTKQKCIWNEVLEICMKFEFQDQKKCEDYKQVTPYVCQMQETDSCIFDSETNNCIKAPENSIITGISIQACLLNNQYPVYWDGEYCQMQQQSEECETPIKVNYLSCRNRILYPCLYDQMQQTCTSQFNVQSLRCSTLGLNLLSCVLVQSEPCIFLDGQCQLFQDHYKPCNELKNINAKVCASVLNVQCQYNEVEYSCQSPKDNYETCNLIGINKMICETNDSCRWNNDYKNCNCKANQLNEQCQLENKECSNNQNCVYENSSCRLKQCYDLLEDQCQGQVFAGAVCFLTKNKLCQPAFKCEDIMNSIQLCSTIYVNSFNCIQGNNQCYSHNNYEMICPLSDCFQNNCILEQGVCRNKQCSDLQTNECKNYDGCYLNMNNHCDDLISCFQINEKNLNEKAASTCNQASNQGRFCNWQQVSIFDENAFLCTNQYCSLFGSSEEICHGNEQNYESCILTKQQICQSCEEIEEECYCNKFQNICKYQKGRCMSILCSHFLNQEDCSQISPRCYWSSRINNGTCLISCSKIFNFDECNERLNECYYDYNTLSCKRGKKILIDLSVDVKIEEFYGFILELFVVLFLQ